MVVNHMDEYVGHVNLSHSNTEVVQQEYLVCFIKKRESFIKKKRASLNFNKWLVLGEIFKTVQWIYYLSTSVDWQSGRMMHLFLCSGLVEENELFGSLGILYTISWNTDQRQKSRVLVCPYWYFQSFTRKRHLNMSPKSFLKNTHPRMCLLMGEREREEHVTSSVWETAIGCSPAQYAPQECVLTGDWTQPGLSPHSWLKSHEIPRYAMNIYYYITNLNMLIAKLNVLCYLGKHYITTNISLKNLKCSL